MTLFFTLWILGLIDVVNVCVIEDHMWWRSLSCQPMFVRRAGEETEDRR